MEEWYCLKYGLTLAAASVIPSARNAAGFIRGPVPDLSSAYWSTYSCPMVTRGSPPSPISRLDSQAPYVSSRLLPRSLVVSLGACLVWRIARNARSTVRRL
jgi:hypothetical protein